MSSKICVSGHSVFLDNNGNVNTFGNNNYYQLGYSLDGSHNTHICLPRVISTTNIISIGCGTYHSICLDADGAVWGFGNNYRGQLGIPQTKKITKPEKIPNLPFIIAISCGSSHTLCLSDENIAYGFGFNENGQLGNASTKDCLQPEQVALPNITHISCGGYHSICIDNIGNLYGFGANNHGQLGTGNTEAYLIPTRMKGAPSDPIYIACGYYHNLILTNDGSVYSFGFNYDGQLGINTNTNSKNIPTKITTLPKIQSISCGYNHSACVDYDGKLWIFGSNLDKRFGNYPIQIKKPIQIPELSNVVTISQGGEHIFVKTEYDKLYACGNNSYGQLGHDDRSCTTFKEIPYGNLVGDNFKYRGKSARK